MSEEWRTQSGAGLGEPPPAPSGGPSGPRAGFWRRFAALFIDGLILAIPNTALILLLDDQLAQFLTLIIDIAYFAYLEGGATGQTLGKRALGIRVIDLRAGGPIGYGRGRDPLPRRGSSPRSRSSWATSGCCGTARSSAGRTRSATSVVVPVDAYPVR